MPSSNGRLRDECLNVYPFTSIEEDLNADLLAQSVHLSPGVLHPTQAR